jgi:hypothetical protein
MESESSFIESSMPEPGGIRLRKELALLVSGLDPLEKCCSTTNASFIASATNKPLETRVKQCEKSLARYITEKP